MDFQEIDARMHLDYQLIDSGDFEKLEQVGPVRLVRPSPQAVWPKRLGAKEWGRVDARFNRFSGGDGKWTIESKSMPKEWLVRIGSTTFTSSITDFGHVGIFPEQFKNWGYIKELVSGAAKKSKGPIEVLNLFAYTGGSTLAAAAGGAHVVHLDASKTSVAWARDNAAASKLDKHPIRWIVDDAQAFVQREVRRKCKYHGVILDPPSYGRGAKGQTWKIEEHLVTLLDQIGEILHEQASFVLLSAHSAGYSPLVLQNLLLNLKGKRKAKFVPEEMVLPAFGEGLPLPSGASCFLIFE